MPKGLMKAFPAKLLPGEIEGIETHFIELHKGSSLQLAPGKNPISIFIATHMD
jgi:hypothetical protein